MPIFKRLKTNSDNKVARRAEKSQFVISILGLIGGILIIIVGAILVFLDIKGESSIEIFGVNVTSAFPGVILWVIGLFVIKFTYYDVEIKGRREK